MAVKLEHFTVIGESALEATAPARLDGWKSIARYLSRDRTTVMRWAATRGLPVHSFPGGKRASVYAIGPELDAWMAGHEGPEGIAGNGLAPTAVTKIGRREFMTGALAISGLGIIAVNVVRRQNRASSEIRPLMEQARLLLHQSTFETENEAIGLYREAVRLAPRNADAWGMLGYACAGASHWRDRVESESLREQATMGGQTALDLEPENALGELALAEALPYMGTNNWLPRDRRLRHALSAQPENPEILFALAFILRFTGHQAESAAMCEQIAPEYHSPIIYNVWIRALWSAGRKEEMERKLEKAASLYPSHKTLWRTRLEILMFSGRVDEATRIARDEQGRPSSIRESELKTLTAFADHLRDRDPGRMDSFLRDQQKNARQGVRQAINAIRFASMSGQIDEAFASAEAYCFSRGFEVGDNMGNGLFSTPDQRHTNFLFEPPTARMRADRRFAKLTEELGLERFWRESGRLPDYRRPASPLGS